MQKKLCYMHAFLKLYEIKLRKCMKDNNKMCECKVQQQFDAYSIQPLPFLNEELRAS